MLHINIVCLGKLKETYWRDAENEYKKRLGPWGQVTLRELKEESFTEKDNFTIVKKKEGERIMDELKKIKDSFIIALDEKGTSFSSEEFANYLNDITMDQGSNITFIIGGPLGLDKAILEKANLRLSMSKFTFTHQMVRIFLLEQIYRAMTITGGKKYHY